MINTFLKTKSRIQEIREKLLKKYGIGENDLRKEYADRYSSDYLEECSEAELIDLVISDISYEEKYEI
jgi:hypothetical protein|tara:strand:+ start:1354 stop:1557 length:204 start_codon:yes stop_codon:yes gene_type:complete